MRPVYFEVPGRPQGKARPRFRRCGGYVHTYTPDATTAYEERVRTAYQQRRKARWARGSPLLLSVEAEFPVPKSASKKKRLAMIGKAHMSKPDADNLLKIVADALNGVAWEDDAQVVQMVCRKRYGEGNGRIRVCIQEADDAMDTTQMPV